MFAGDHVMTPITVASLTMINEQKYFLRFHFEWLKWKTRIYEREMEASFL